MRKPPCHHIDTLLNAPGNYVTDIKWEPLEKEPPECAKCGAPMRLWYQEVFNSDDEYLDTLALYKCARWKHCNHYFYVCEKDRDQ